MAQLFASGMHWVTFSPLQNILGKLDFSLAQINLFSLIYIGLPPLFSGIQIYFIHFFSLKRCLQIAGILHVIGGILKCFVFESLFVAYFGQVLVTFSQTLLMNNFVNLPVTWFKNDKAPLLCAISSVTVSIGLLTGYSFYQCFISTDTPVEELNDATLKYLAAQAILLGVLSAPSVFLARSAPSLFPLCLSN